MGYNTVEPKDVPEVMAYVEASQQLESFRTLHKKIFQQYMELAENTNQKREAADKAVRAKGVSCGPWEYYQNQEKFNAQALYETLGQSEFLRVGGILQTKTVYDVDKNKINSAIARGEISQDVASVVKTIIQKYHAPKDVGL